MDESNEPSNLDCPLTPWEEDDPYPDTQDEPGEEPWVIADNITKSEMKKLEDDLNQMIVDDTPIQFWSVNGQRPRTVNGVRFEFLPTPEDFCEWFESEEVAEARAIEKAKAVLKMSEAVRREFIAFNVSGPWATKEKGHSDEDHPTHRDPAKRRTTVIVSTRIYKKGTDEVHIARLSKEPLVSSHDQFENRFKDGVIPFTEILERAAQCGVTGPMAAYLSAVSDERELNSALDHLS